MKNQTGIWIDGSKAIIVKLEDGKEEVSEIKAEVDNAVHHNWEGDKGTFMGARHMNNERKINERKIHQIDRYLGNVVNKIKEAKEVYVFGPAEAKMRLQQKILASNTFAPNLRMVESAGKMTPNQIVAKVKTFFTKKP